MKQAGRARHVLERRFEFSTQSAGGWLLFQAKNLLLFLILSMLGSFVWFGLLRLFPRGWVLVVPAAFTVFQGVLSFLLPYANFLLVGWILMLVAWYLAGFSVGPDSPIALVKG